MSSFQERQKCLFNQLKDAEEQYSFSKTNKADDSPNHGEVDKQTYRRLKREMKQFRGKESIFKRPGAKIQDVLKHRKVPEFQKNPQKWKYYSLADVTPDQMSESTNRATALALMKRLEEEEASNNKMDCDSDEFVFKKPIFQVSSTIKRMTAMPDNDDAKVVFKSSRVVMPEYVVGVTKKKDSKKVIRKSTESTETEKKNELKLNHLYENDDE